jgi:thiamine monophosphate synthase
MVDDLSPKKGNEELPKRWFFTDDVRVPDPIKTIETLDARIGVIVRYSNLDLIKKIAVLCLQQNRVFLIKDNYEIAKDVEAKGLHLSERALDDFSAIPNIGFMTAACHTKEAFIKAQSLGVDGVFISPIFATNSHVGRPTLTHTQIKEILNGLNPSPEEPDIFALGGMTEKRFRQLTENPHFKAFSGYGAIGHFLP